MEILQLSYEVLIMDATYKTNRYKLPLLIITGVTSLNTKEYGNIRSKKYLTKQKTNDVIGRSPGLIEDSLCSVDGIVGEA